MKKTVLSFLLATVLLVNCLIPVSAAYFEVESGGIIRETLTSAIDGSPLPVEFDESTGVVSVLDANGAVRYTRKVGSADAFRELVAINKEVTSQPIEKRKMSKQTNRTGYYIEIERGVLVEIDANGNKSETVLTKEHAAMFPTSRVFTGGGSLLRSLGTTRISSKLLKDVRMSIPKSNRPKVGGKLLGGKLYAVPSTATSVDLWTYDIPSSVKAISAYITNEIGDNGFEYPRIPANADIVHRIDTQREGERYGAYISSQYGSGSNVHLSLYASFY